MWNTEILSIKKEYEEAEEKQRHEHRERSQRSQTCFFVAAVVSALPRVDSSSLDPRDEFTNNEQ